MYTFFGKEERASTSAFMVGVNVYMCYTFLFYILLIFEEAYKKKILFWILEMSSVNSNGTGRSPSIKEDGLAQLSQYK